MPYKFNPFTGTFDDVNLSTGAQGPQGPAGATGPAGVVAATAPITYNSGTQTISTSLATNKLLGRSTAGTGVAEEITLGTNLSFSGTTLNATGGGGTPGGTNTQIQFNDGGSAFGGDADLTWNSTTNVLGVTGDVNLSDGGTFTTTLQTITPTADRTISLPNATGTVALVAGSSEQLLWNNAGVNAGASTVTYDGSILTTSGRFINSYNATASSPAKAFTGTWFITGTATTTKPHLLIEPTGTTSTGWSTTGTGLGVNAASGFSGNLLDLQVNGTSQVKVASSGRILFSNVAGGATTYPLNFGGSDSVGVSIGRNSNDGLFYFYGAQTAVYGYVFTGARGEALRINTSDNLQFAEGKNIETGTTTGTKIGTATTQKLGFYNKTPVVQPVAVADATTSVDVITQFNALLSRMRDLGLIAT